MTHCRERRTLGGRDGFTIAEAITGTLFMAVLVPVLVDALLVANSAGVAADRGRVAARLADGKLTESVVTGDWRYGDFEDSFGEDYPGYRWALRRGDWEADAMRVVSVEVFYRVRGRERSVYLATLVEEAEP